MLQLHSLRAVDFRNYERIDLSFQEGVSLFYGANGQGKTNALEAIALFITGRSFRTSRLTELVRHSAQSFVVELVYSRCDVRHTLRIASDGTGRRIWSDNTLLSSTQQLLGLVPGVVYSPADLDLVKGAPAQRRRYLDVHLAQADPKYVVHLNRYTRALKQRNHLLRSRSAATLSTWEHELARSGCYLRRRRQEAVDELEPLVRTAFCQLGFPEEELNLRYIGGEVDESALIERLAASRTREFEFGHTLVGPHRDDLRLFCHGHAARLYASEGQQRGLVLALRMAERERLARRCQLDPLFILDDALASLDETKQRNLVDMLGGWGPVFLSSPERPPSESIHAYHVDRARISPPRPAMALN